MSWINVFGLSFGIFFVGIFGILGMFALIEWVDYRHENLAHILRVVFVSALISMVITAIYYFAE